MSDLTTQEQDHVRAALRFLRARFGGWQHVATALRFKVVTVQKVGTGLPVSASMAVRVARLASVGLDALLAGEYPPAGACPTCGHIS